MQTTAGSSAPYQNALDRTVPSTYAGQLCADLNELQAYRAQQPYPGELERLKAEVARLQAAQAEQDQRLDDGRRQTSKRLRALVLTAIQNTRAKLEEDVSTNRRNTIEQHLTMKWEHYGLERLSDGTVKLPNRKLINQVLKSQGL